MDDDEEYLRLMVAVAKSEGLNVKKGKNAVPTYTPIFKHPLPISEHKFYHENNLKRIMSCKKEFQAIAAISQCDGWVLEEVYMRGGKEVLGEKNGNTPLHMAIQMGSIDCLLVLMNIGVDVNKVNSLGFTPLQIAVSKGEKHIEKLLREHGARLEPAIEDQAPDVTVLEIHPEQKYLDYTKRDITRDAYLLTKETKYY
jgi:hypothetical protein